MENDIKPESHRHNCPTCLAPVIRQEVGCIDPIWGDRRRFEYLHRPARLSATPKDHEPNASEA